jgi:hypothetical protein
LAVLDAVRLFGGDALEHRETEAERLARSGLRLAADVSSGERVADGHGLDREGGHDALGR